MPKRVHRKRMSRRMAGKGGELGVVEGAKNVGETVYNVGASAVGEAGALLGSAAEKGKEGVSWFGSWFSGPAAPVVPAQQQQVAAQGGSRRRRKQRKPNKMFSGLMKMMGMKTKKRGRRGGIGGPSNGYMHIVGANFPSAANAQGNNIYDLAPFDPSKPFTGGMKGGCSPSRSSPLSPAPYPSDSLMGGMSKRHRKRHGGTKKCAWK